VGTGSTLKGKKLEEKQIRKRLTLCGAGSGSKKDSTVSTSLLRKGAVLKYITSTGS